MDLKYIHSTTIDILKEIDKLCQKHNISYFLMYGSLLGAIRHNGFIPWDDDLDIAMFRDDYEKFLEIAKKELPEFFTLCESRYEHRYTNIFAKVFKTDTQYSSDFFSKKLNINGLWVDIFPLDFLSAKDRTEAEKKFRRRQKLTIFLRILFENRYNINSQLSTKMRLLCKAARILPVTFWLWLINRIFSWDKPKGSNYCVDYNLNVNRGLFPINSFLATQSVTFENERFPIPCNYELVLTNLYGDYMTLPPEEERSPSHDLILNEEK